MSSQSSNRAMKEDPRNHQPVSLTSTFAKVIECLILEAMSSTPMEDKKVVRCSHHGFT